MENIGQAFSEVYDIINHLEEKLYNKIPKNFIETVKKNKDDEYKPNIDYSKSINEQELLKDTRIILAAMYREYICTPEKKAELIKNDIEELKREEQRKKEQFQYEDLFKNKEKPITKNENVEITKYKESTFNKVVNFIKRLFSKK